MLLAGPTAPPTPYVEFCETYTEECHDFSGADDVSRPRLSVPARSMRVAAAASTTSVAKASVRRPQAQSMKSALAEGAPIAEGRLALNSATWRQLNRTNFVVNRSIRYLADEEGPGQSIDTWSLPLRGAPGKYPVGDCEDYALEKRRLLRAAGIPASALSIAIVMLADGQWHAVLVVETNRGDYVLDNLSASVTPWGDTPYYWHMRESGGRASDWRFVDLRVGDVAADAIS